MYPRGHSRSLIFRYEQLRRRRRHQASGQLET
jgi:hypothetical protein